MPSRTGTHRPSYRVTGRHYSQDDQTWRTGKTTAQQGYGYRWQQARAAYLREHPLCCACEGDSRLRAATEVDHIKPHKGDAALFWDKANWQPLCRQHHSIKTAQENGFGRASHPRGGGKKS